MTRVLGTLYWAALALLCAAIAVAQTPQYNGSIPDFYEEPGLVPNRDYVHHTQDEFIDPFTGALKLVHTDLVLPGNGGLDIRLQRVYASSYAYARNSTALQPSVVGVGWSMHFGRVVSHAPLSGLCTDLLFWTKDNPVLELPDGTAKLLARATGVYATQGFYWVTADFWRARCDSSGNLFVYPPDGRELFFPIANARSEPNGPWARYAYYIGSVRDRHGNSLTYTYHPTSVAAGNLQYIASSDGRRVDFVYTGTTLQSTRLTEVRWSDGASVYTNVYTTEPVPNLLNERYHLRSVTLGSSNVTWQYSYNASAASVATGGERNLASVTNPWGGITNYTYALRSAVAQGMDATSVIAQKTRGGLIWTYRYAYGASYDETVVTTPLWTERYRYVGVLAAVTQVGVSFSRVGLLMRKEIGTAQVEEYTWELRQISTEPYVRRDITGLRIENAVSAPVLQARRITRDGHAYSTSFGGWDELGNPASIAESGPAGTRTHEVSYCYTSPSGLRGGAFEQRRTISGVGTIARTPDGACRPITENRFGTVTSYNYHAAGEISRKTDANGNYVDYPGYVRGIPTQEDHKDVNHVLLARITRTVNAKGNITSVTDATGFTTGYRWDGVNRLTAVDHPINNDMTISYPLTTRRVLTRGALVDTLALDNWGNPVSRTTGGITVAYGYDAMLRQTFASYPGTPGTGTTFAYDDIGRLRRSVHPDQSVSLINFSPGGSTVQDERGVQQVLAQRIYGDPNERVTMSVAYPAQPASNISFVRDGQDRITAVTRGGLTRSFRYNARNCLDQEVHPETGTTTYDVDNVCNVLTKTVGSATALHYSYDGLNRLKTVIYTGGGTPNVAFDYFADGKLRYVQSGTGSSAVTRSFTYDANRNLTVDALNVDGMALSSSLGYDGNDQLRTVTYPLTGAIVDYFPDVLGRPLQLIATRSGISEPLVSNVTHYPSGLMQAWVYGNNVISSMGQHRRLWPSSVSYTRKSYSLASQAYGYDATGNVTSITDALSNYGFSSLGYDALNQLVNINSATGCQICYDAVGNIISRSWPGPAVTYSYDGSNRLKSLSGGASATFGYDARGNVTTDGTFRYAYNEASNLVQVATQTNAPVANYTYDGKNMRVKIERAGKRPTYTFHTQGGNLLVEYDAETRVITEYFYLEGQQVARRSTVPAVTTGHTSLTPPPSWNPPGASAALATVHVPKGATGTVSFYTTSGPLIGTALVSNSTTATYNFSSLQHGCYNVRARYDGDFNFAPSDVGTFNVCVGSIDFSPILQLLLEDDE